jgi:hypothetical protein
MDSTTWGDRTKLQAWLRGEYGVRWSFIAVQLDAGGGEVRRLAAPRTASTPQAYLPIEVDERTRQLLFVVTSLSNALPDADEEDVHPRSFELIVDGAGD